VRVCADSELNLSNDAVRLEIQGVLHYCNRGRFKKIELLSILLLHFVLYQFTYDAVSTYACVLTLD
jgi:hypothetical protein